MKTLNQIVSILNDFANAHQQVNSFGSGQLEDFATSGVTEYPTMWVDFEPSQVDAQIFSNIFRIYLADRQDKGQFNQNHCLSDMQLVALDLIAYLKDPIVFYNIRLQDNITLNPFFEGKFDDEIVGVYFDITFNTAFLEDRCHIPFTSGFTPTNYDSSQMTTIDKEVPSGTLNGVNTIFTLLYPPHSGTEYVYLNGQLLSNGTDYTINGNIITFVNAPFATDKIYVSYRF